MSITESKAFVTSNGMVFADMADAQKQEIVQIVRADFPSAPAETHDRIADCVIEHSEAIVEILTMTPRKKGRPPGRKNKVPSLKAAEKIVGEMAAQPPAA